MDTPIVAWSASLGGVHMGNDCGGGGARVCGGLGGGGVREVGAVGVPDEKSGEVVKIVVVRKDETLTDVELIAHCRRLLTGYKTPRHVEFRTELPHTPIGKILRRELRSTGPASDVGS